MRINVDICLPEAVYKEKRKECVDPPGPVVPQQRFVNGVFSLNMAILKGEHYEMKPWILGAGDPL